MKEFFIGNTNLEKLKEMFSLEVQPQTVPVYALSGPCSYSCAGDCWSCYGSCQGDCEGGCSHSCSGRNS